MADACVYLPYAVLHLLPRGCEEDTIFVDASVAVAVPDGGQCGDILRTGVV